MNKITYVLLLIVIVFCHFNVTAKSLTRKEYEKALQEVSWAFYMRGEYIQYNSQKTNASGYYSPEEATSQNMNYSVCSGYTYYVYSEFLNIQIPHFTNNHIEYARNNQVKVGAVDYVLIKNIINPPKPVNTSNTVSYSTTVDEGLMD